MSTQPLQIGNPAIIGAPGLHDAITLADLKVYLGDTLSTKVPDAAYQSLISGVSQEFLSETGLPGLAPAVRTEQRDTKGRDAVGFAYVPAIKMLSVKLNNLPVSPSPDGIQVGYAFTPTIISFVGASRFAMWTRSTSRTGYSVGSLNLTMSYIAGYGAYQVDSGTVPDSSSGYQMRVGQANQFVQDFGVSYANSRALLAVPNGDPTTLIAGQYMLLPASPNSAYPQGVYQFAAADIGQPVTISYTYKAIPTDIQLAVKEWCAYRWQRRTQLNVTSQGQQGQNTTYSKGKPDSIRDVLSRYKRPLITV